MQQILRTYIPIDRYAALAAGRDLPDRTWGAALFADISGFTPLTTALAREYGSFRGAEEMTSSMQRIYEVLVNETHRYGGSVVSFCGDAIICWFDDTYDSHNPATTEATSGDAAESQPSQLAGAKATARAAACGMAMQLGIPAYATISVPSGATFSVAIKVMIATGSVRRFLPGDSAIRRIDVLAGEAITAAAVANSLALPGEVLLNELAAAALGIAAESAEWRADPPSGTRFAVLTQLRVTSAAVPWHELPALIDTPAARAWLWPAVYDRLQQGSDRLISELRPVVALFLSFDGINYDADDAAGARLDQFIRHVQQVLIAYEGAFIELTIGDKGSYLYAAFGAPIAHDDDAARAVAAGYELCHLPPDLGFISAIRIGITRGQAYTGIYGGTARRTYGVQGDKVNLAARLMEHAAPWTICCDTDAAARAADRWSFQALPEIRVKGKSDPVAIFRLIGPQRDSARPSFGRSDTRPLIGRSTELAQVEQALTALDSGGCQVLWIEGDPGIGKSRLVEELGLLAERRGFAPLIGAGESTGQRSSYHAWNEIFTSLLGLHDLIGSLQRLAHVSERLDRLVPGNMARLPLLNDILHLGAPETTLTAGIDPALRQESLSQLANTLLGAYGRAHAPVIILEDAQWLDSLSWMLATYIARAFAVSSQPLLLVIVTRPIDDQEPNARLANTLQALEQSIRLPLTMLAPEETVALAAARLNLPPNGLPAAVAASIQRRAGGNPFFAEELVLALRDRGIITVEDEPARGASRCVLIGDLAAAEETLPTTLHELVLSRIDRLPPDRQLVLKVAAVIGRTFAYTPLHWTLSAYAASPGEVLRTHLAELARSNMTVLEALEPDLTYLFKHVITRDAAYQTLLFAQRKQLHRIVAKWYERIYTQNGARMPAEGAVQPSTALFSTLLAHHYRQAEDIPRERIYARLAGEQAAAQYANLEAINYLSRALALTPADDYAARYTLLLSREKVYDLQGARDAQRADLDALAALAEALAENRRRAEVALRRSAFANMIDDIALAVQSAKQAVALAQSAGRRDIEAAANQWWGLILWMQGQHGARIYFERALTLARDAGLIDVEAQSMAALGNVAWLEGDYHAAAGHYAAALPSYQAAGDRRGESTTITNLGVVAQIQGDYADAQNHYEHALRIKRELGDRRGESKVLSALASLFAELGLYDRARDHYQLALQICREIGGRAGECEILYLRAELLNQISAYSEAVSLAEHAAGIAQEIGSRDDYARALLPLGDAQAGLGNHDAADDAYRMALEIWADLGLDNMTPLLIAGRAQVAFARGDLPEALKFVAQIIVQQPGGAAEVIDGRHQIATVCFQVLHAAGDARAVPLLRASYTTLQNQAARIADQELRRSFLERVAAHRTLAQIHQSLAADT